MSQAQIVTDSDVLQTSNAQILDISRPEVYSNAPQEQPQQLDQQALVQALQQLQANQQPQQPSQQSQQPFQQPQQPAQPPAPLDPAFVGQFESYTGMKPEQFQQAVQQFQQMQQFVAQQQQQAQVNTLRNEWGEQFESVMPEISKRFAALPPQMQASLDNLDGARLLYAQYMQELAAQGVQVPQAQPPQYDRSRTPQPRGNSQEPQFTQRQILDMSESDYIKNQNAIMYAYQNGLVRK